MISKVFKNIEVENIEHADKISSIWKKVVSGIKNTRDEYYGEKIAAHTEIVEFKNGQLLIEADHPGWIQAMQLYSKFIIRGMQMNIKNFRVENLCFRLKGSNANFAVDYEKALERANKKNEEKFIQDEKEVEDFYKKSGAFGALKNSNSHNLSNTNTQETENCKEKLPPDFLAKLASLESTLLTNSKNK
ncbi:MAG: DUF721 domain-containing protein [Treponema sp.]|nr:DUF721 domain-containing protein [Treponema sp.]